MPRVDAPLLTPTMLCELAEEMAALGTHAMEPQCHALLALAWRYQALASGSNTPSSVANMPRVGAPLLTPTMLRELAEEMAALGTHAMEPQRHALLALAWRYQALASGSNTPSSVRVH